MIEIANIKDIAKKAGVSVATVSHVINKNYYVSDKLIKKVKNAIKKLNYSPNLVAGSLRSKKTGTIGLIVPDISNPNTAELAKYIEENAYKYGYNIIICNSAYDIEIESKNLEMLISKRVDGILMFPETTEDSFFKKVRDAKIPIVLIERKIPIIKNLDIILFNHFNAGYIATKHLLDLGHRNIVFIDRKQDKLHSMARRTGYLKALEENKIEIDNNLIIRGDLSCSSGYDVVQTILKWEKRVTAVECFGDLEALGAISAALKARLEIPKDISIMGYDDLSLSKYITPELTTIRMNTSEISKQATRILMSRIETPVVKKYIIKTIEPELLVRDSTTFAPKK